MYTSVYLTNNANFVNIMKQDFRRDTKNIKRNEYAEEDI